jgi:exopolyphosphatase / guanosine-5'-triphosphate,3'-diphosphate pyrophosphatase
MDPATSAIIDIGGGSTEFVSQSEAVSIDMGAVRFTERYLASDPVTDREFWKCREEIEKALAPAVEWRKRNPQVTNLVAVAGTPTSLAAWYHGLPAFDAAKIDRTVLARGDLHRQVEELKYRTVAERAALPGIQDGRAPVILAGSLILWRSLEVLGFPSCTVSTRGLLFGIIC